MPDIKQLYDYYQNNPELFYVHVSQIYLKAFSDTNVFLKLADGIGYEEAKTFYRALQEISEGKQTST